MQLRMRHLTERTGCPRSTVQHYIREGLLPPPKKLARNSAVYDEQHVQRLESIQRAKELLGDRPPVAQLRRVLELVDHGVEPEVAVTLQRAVWLEVGDSIDASDNSSYSTTGLAKHLGISAGRVKAMARAGVILPAPGAGRARFDGLDVRMAKLHLTASERLDIDLDLLAEITDLMSRISEIEMQIRNQAVRGKGTQEVAEVSAELQSLGNAWQPYVRLRLRQRDIAQQGLGPGSAA